MFNKCDCGGEKSYHEIHSKRKEWNEGNETKQYDEIKNKNILKQ